MIIAVMNGRRLARRVRLTPALYNVAAVVAEEFGYEVEEIFAHGREQPRVFVRQVVYALCYETCGVSSLTLARAFDVDHTAILHAAKTVESRSELEPGLGEQVARSRSMVRSKAQRERHAAILTMDALAGRGIHYGRT